MKIRNFLVILVMLFIANAGYAWDGNGDEGNPYLIKTTDDLKLLAVDVNGGTDDSGKYFQLTTDLDFKGKDFTPIGNEGDDPESLADNKPSGEPLMAITIPSAASQ